MRSTIILLAAVALGAAPAAAQNNAVDANAIAVNNEVAADPNLTANVPIDNLAAAPPLPGSLEPPQTVEQEDQIPADTDGGFPWGLIGLVGLVGLLGRARS
jgi:hypothetical protein